MRTSDRNCRALLLLVPGSGFAEQSPSAADDDSLLVPSGLWSTEKFAEEAGLDDGSMVPYVAWALHNGMRPLVLRGNSESDIAAALESIKCLAAESLTNGVASSSSSASSSSAPPSLLASSSSPRNTNVGELMPITVALVAHSEGGAAVVRLIRSHPQYFNDTPSPSDGLNTSVVVRCVALLDSVHTAKDLPPAGSAGAAFLSGAGDNKSKRCVNWVQSRAPLDSQKPKPWVKNGTSGGCNVRSAGTMDHLRVPAVAMPSVLRFIGGAMGTPMVATSAEPHMEPKPQTE